MSLLKAALALAANGTPVFPCGPDKAPRVADGYYAATTDAAQIRAWTWDGMIGAAIPEGTVVIDIDPRNGGDETMALFPKIGRTKTVKTMSGGTHVYLKTELSADELRSSLGPGVDVKRPGKGYVIVPPSEGYRYPFFAGTALMPQWLVAELKVEASERQGEAHEPKFFTSFEHGTAYGLAALDKQIGKLVQARAGGRNDALNRAAFSLAQLGAGGELEWEHAAEVLADIALNIGLEPEETAKTIESGRLAGEQEPWQAPGDKAPTAAHTQPWAPSDEQSFWVNWEVDEPDLPFYCWPVLPKNAYILAYGATAASKSMAWVGLLAEGSHHGVKSSVYSLENPPATDRQRVRRWRPERTNFRITNEHLDLADARQVEALILRERQNETDVIMVDTYSHAFHSRSDDGNAKAIAFAQTVRYVMAEVGCSVLVIDHTGYGDHDEPRDASAKRQQVDVAVLMKQAGVWQKGQPARFTMDNKKATRFANPFFLTGEIRDTKDKGLALGWVADAPSWRAQ